MSIRNYDKKLKIIASSLLALMLLITLTMPQLVYATATATTTNTMYSSELGTNKALGSPLLSSTFEADDWNPYEMICFGVFLSNYCTKFGYDNYETAFSKTAKSGSKGKAYDALVFGTGTSNEETAKKALDSMLNYAINRQKANGKQIYRKTKIIVHTDEGDKSYSGDYTKAEAHFMDMMMLPADNESVKLIIDKDKYVMSTVICRNLQNVLGLTGLNYVYGTGYVGYEFYVMGENNQPITIFNSLDAWDMQQLASYISALNSYEMDYSYLKDIMDNNGNLEFDAFGNICVKNGTSKKIILPASCNQYLTDTPSYNLITTATINSSYSQATTNNILRYMDFSQTSTKNSLTGTAGVIKRLKDSNIGITDDIGNAIEKATNQGNYSFDIGMVKSTGGEYNLRDGQHMYALDTNTYIGDYLSKNGLKSKSNAINDWGIGIVNILNSKITGDASLNCGFITLPIGQSVTKAGFFESLFKTARHKYLSNNTAITLNTISNSITVNKDRKRLTTVQMTSGKQSIFGNPVYVAANIPASDANYPLRVTINEMFRYLDGTSVKNNPNVTDLPSSSIIVNNLRNAKTPKDVANVLFCGSTTGSTASALFRNSLFSNNAVDTTKATETLSKNNISLDAALSDCTIKSVSGTVLNSGASSSFSADKREKAVTRIVKVYPRSDILIKLCNNLNGTASHDDFGALTPYIYMTYYDWYGITGTTGNKFNSQLFSKTDDILSTTGEDLFENTFQTSEEKQKSVLNYAYLLLNPNSADSKEYKTSLFDNAITGTMYNQYLKLTESNSSDIQLGSVANIRAKTSGFLNVPTLTENWITSLLAVNYTNIAVLLLGCSILIVIVIGIISKRGKVWYLISIATMINILILTPAISEINPYICNKIVQGVFAKHSDYWAIAEDISNLQQEQEAIKASADTDSQVLSDQTLASIVRDLSIVYLDSSIQIKNDISRKVVESSDETVSKMQNTLAARWLIPVLMRQSSGDKGTADYVYTSLLDLYNNQQNVYWYYRPESMNDSKTLNATSVTKKDTTDRGADIITDTNYKISQYSKYKKIDDMGSLWKNENDKDNYTLSLTRTLDDEYKTHTGYYLVDFNTLNDLGTGCTPENLDVTGLREAEVKMEQLASDYQSSVGADQCFGYLETTENPSLYFYMLVRDMCDGQLFETDKIEAYTDQTNDSTKTQEVTSSSVASIVANLQGKIVKKVDVSTNGDGSEYKLLNEMTTDEKEAYSEKELEKRTKTCRVSFMHTGKTGYIRDFADTEELFTNVIPYMYDMYVVARGTDIDENGKAVYSLSDLSDTTDEVKKTSKTGKNNNSSNKYSALFQDGEKMSNFALYKDNDKSWFWRSNWAIKLLEDNDLNRERVAYKRIDGKRVAITLTGTPMNPRNYPTDRPMVFSEAQMNLQGLKENDLTLPELKILKFNSALERRWTLLLNYANASGMSPEIMYRQMALSATLEFNKAFDTGRGFNGSKTLYPQALDLSNISYDNVLRLVLLNTTGNTAYLQTSPVKALFQTGSVLTHLTVLLSAYGSEFIMPLFRNGYIAFLMLLAIAMSLKHIIAPVNTKVRVSLGYILSNIVFIGINIIYFMMFKLLIATTTPDEALTIGKVNTASGSPTMITFLILLADIVYCVMVARLGITVFRYRNDMGYGVYISKLGELTDGIKNAFGKVTGLFGGNTINKGDTNTTAGNNKDNLDNNGNTSANGKVTGKVKLDDNDETDETIYNDIDREESNYSNFNGDSDNIVSEGKTGIDFREAVEQGKKNLENKEKEKNRTKDNRENKEANDSKKYKNRKENEFGIDDFLDSTINNEPSKDYGLNEREPIKGEDDFY